LLFSLAFNPLVIQERLLPQLFGISLLNGGQWAGRRPVSTWQPIKEGAQAFHARSVTATPCPARLWICVQPLSSADRSCGLRSRNPRMTVLGDEAPRCGR
jgi:hypothetical protein